MSEEQEGFSQMNDEQTGADLDQLKRRITGYYRGWGFEDGQARSANARRFYAPDRDLVLYDTQPPVEGFPDVETLHRGVAERAGAAGIRSVRFTPRLDQVEARMVGTLAWTITPYRVTATFPDGRELAVEPTQTHVWERRDGDWLIVHEHTAPPNDYAKLLATGEVVESIDGPRDGEAETLTDRWLDAERGIKGAAADDSHLRRIGLGTPPPGILVRRRGAVRLWRHPHVAWATYLVMIETPAMRAIGRDSLVMTNDEAAWRVVHSHRSVPFVAGPGGHR